MPHIGGAVNEHEIEKTVSMEINGIAPLNIFFPFTTIYIAHLYPERISFIDFSKFHVLGFHSFFFYFFVLWFSPICKCLSNVNKNSHKPYNANCK
jgi:hypothetical protein